MAWLKLVLTAMQLLLWLARYAERAGIIKQAEVDATSRLLAALRSEADAITQDFDAAARRADADGVRDPYERD